MKLVVVFDTSVLLSAIGWGGRPGQCVELAKERRIVAFTCTEILRELSEKLASKARFSDEQVIEVLNSLHSFLQPIKISGAMTGLCSDPKDDMVLECALVSGATHVVSGDKKHLLAMKEFRGISIVSPAELLHAFGAANP